MRSPLASNHTLARDSLAFSIGLTTLAAMNWYYVEGGQQIGPVDDATLGALAGSGKITAATLVWREGMPNWQPYQQVAPVGTVSATGEPAAFAPAQEEAVCAECGGIFPLDDTIKIGNAR